MPRLILMTWEGPPNFRWSKMYKGTRYRVTCDELKAHVDTKEATWKAANEWWERKLANLLGHPAEAERQANERNWEVAWKTLGGADPKTKDIFENLLGNKEAVPIEDTVGHAIDEFLGVLARGQKPKTFKEVQEVLAFARSWWGPMSPKEITPVKVTAAWAFIAEQDVEQGTRKKRWNIIKQFVAYMVETGRCEMPSNLYSRRLRFKVKQKAVQSWALSVVRSALRGLPDRFRLYALLGLNAGMTNIDIAELRKDMIVKGVLTRKRVKTEDHTDVPVVRYKLWPETLALLDQFRSNHADLWLTARGREGVVGAKLVDHRIVGGKVLTKDLIYLNWRRQVKGCPIPLFKFRSVSASLLDTFGKNHVPHFLGHSPKSTADKFYVALTDEKFFEALDWLRGQVLGGGS